MNNHWEENDNKMLINILLETLQGNGTFSGTSGNVVPGGGPSHLSIGSVRLTIAQTMK